MAKPIAPPPPAPMTKLGRAARDAHRGRALSSHAEPHRGVNRLRDVAIVGYAVSAVVNSLGGAQAH